MVDIVQSEIVRVNGVIYSYTGVFSMDETSQRSRSCIFDDARRVWVNGKLLYSEFPQDWINDDRSLPVVIAADKTANSRADA